jgi:hypothetical protein
MKNPEFGTMGMSSYATLGTQHQDYGPLTSPPEVPLHHKSTRNIKQTMRTSFSKSKTLSITCTWPDSHQIMPFLSVARFISRCSLKYRMVAEATTTGNLDQQRMEMWSTQPKPPNEAEMSISLTIIAEGKTHFYIQQSSTQTRSTLTALVTSLCNPDAETATSWSSTLMMVTRSSLNP